MRNSSWVGEIPDTRDLMVKFLAAVYVGGVYGIVMILVAGGFSLFS